MARDRILDLLLMILIDFIFWIYVYRIYLFITTYHFSLGIDRQSIGQFLLDHLRRSMTLHHCICYFRNILHIDLHLHNSRHHNLILHLLPNRHHSCHHWQDQIYLFRLFYRFSILPRNGYHSGNP